jgi:hypothetical protein
MTVSSANGSAGPLSQNYVINGGFDIWQRGSSAATGLVYGADRWIGFGTSPNSLINTNTPSSVFAFSNNVYGSTNTGIQQRIESLNSRLLVGQVVTVSFWARNYSSSGQFRVSLDHANTADNFSAITNIETRSTDTIAPSGSVWGRYSFTFNLLPNQVSNGLAVTINLTGTSSVGFLITGVQLEAGPVVTPFRRHAPNIQAELAACQRYYIRYNASSTGETLSPVGGAVTNAIGEVVFSVPSRFRSAIAGGIDVSNVGWYSFGNGVVYSGGTVTSQSSSLDHPKIRYTHGSGVLSAGQAGQFVSSSGTAFLGFSAEL